MHEIPTQLWLKNELLSKSQDQRKKRTNCHADYSDHFRLNKFSKDNSRYSLDETIDNRNHTGQSRNLKFQRGSLEDVYHKNKYDKNHFENTPSLRRCRSLALTNEQIYNSLEIRNEGRTSRRAQLIPRAKLVGKSFRDQRYESRYASTEDLIDRSIKTTRKKQLKPTSPSDNFGSNQDSQICQFVEQNEYDSLEFQQQKNNEIPGLNLPNYYPDSRYESDNTDNVSIIENISSSSFGYKKYLSYDNLSIQNFQEEPESISYDENIVLSKNRPLYNSLRNKTYEKPRTIRSPSAITSEEYFSATIRKSGDKCKLYKKSKSDEELLKTQRKNAYTTRGDQNRIDNNSTSGCQNIEINPVYEPSEYVQEFKENKEIIANETKDEDLATRVEIEYESQEIREDFKTVVRVDSNTTSISNTTDEEIKTKHKEKQHSHNYLREFLESQKGSKKPLQNFLIKKLPNLPRKKSNEKRTNLVGNNFHSLPDITARKNLKKSYKIDKKLRKCETNIDENDNRFIVNIGRHFDIAVDKNIPVDFELKIAKVSKKNKQKHAQEDFLQAIKDLKHTLELNHNDNENLTINSNDTDKPKKQKSHKRDSETSTKPQENEMKNRRNMFSEHKTEKDKNNQELKCKIVDMKKKVAEIKRKFEQEERQTNAPKSKSEKLGNTSFSLQEENQPFESLNPNIVEIIEQNNEQNESNIVESTKEETKTTPIENKKQHKQVTKSLSITYPEFDHVRYRVVKSNFFQKKIFTNYGEESQFDGLMQYLQDYSFQEMLIDNNIIIIEPIRTTVVRENGNHQKPARNVTPCMLQKNEDNTNKLGLKKHFFYHPIRVNKEVNDDELPNPDTVKQVREMFERSEKHCDIKSEKKGKAFERSNFQNSNVRNENLSLDSFDDEPCCEQQYITEDMMENIRKYGSSVTYYGGRIVRKQSSHDSLTTAIMEEIRDNENRNNSKYKARGDSDIYEGLRFKLVKSNSCSSRLELVGTQNSIRKEKSHSSKKTGDKRDQENDSKNRKNYTLSIENERIMEDKKKNFTKWVIADVERNKNEKITEKAKYQYHNFEQSKKKTGVEIEDMDFEPFEIA